uniref:B30.2/SPRY domain-containing protein n=1 Tax=Astyanax mexicanus TaxID=7994 RepID=A0A3B1JMI4_ASTMX
MDKRFYEPFGWLLYCDVTIRKCARSHSGTTPHPSTPTRAPPTRSCSLTLDPNTASVELKVSEGDKEAWHYYPRDRKQPLPYHPERFKWYSQVMCREGLSGRHFCQVEWFGRFATIGVAYKDMSRKGPADACTPGENKKSWAIKVSTPSPLSQAVHDGVETRLPDRSPWRVGVYLDWAAGILSFYDVTRDKAELIHTFYAKFTGPLYLVFSITHPGLPEHTGLSGSIY